MAKVLVVEDESLIAETILHSLRSNHYEAELAEDGEAALEMLLSNSYDLVILDWNLPKMTGPEVCRRYSSAKGTTLILMLTGNASVNDKVEGLDAGADDYLTKPFDLRELHARVSALLKRAGSKQNGNFLTAGDVTMEPANFVVRKAGVDINLARKEFAILELLMRYQDRVFSVDEIISRVWHMDEQPSSDVIRSHIKNIRKKFEDENVIRTVRGVGYKV